MNQKNQKGITLIALVVTIIVLLILAGVTINMVLGDDGIIGQAQQAKAAQEDKEKEEQDELDKGAGNIDLYKEGSLASKVEVGDYVEYIYDAPEEGYTTPTAGNGEVAAETQTFSSKNGGNAAVSNWRVLSKENGIIKLVPENATSGELALEYKKGFKNGEKVLDEMCKTLYSSNIGKAESIKLSDFDNIFAYKIENIGVIGTAGNGVIRVPYGTTIGELIDMNNAKEGVTLFEKSTLESQALEENKNILDYKVTKNVYEYNAETASEAEKLIFLDSVNSKRNYWVANRYVAVPTLRGSSVWFGMQEIEFTNNALSQLCLGYSDTFSDSLHSNSVFPIVTLKTGLMVGEGDGSDAKPWEIKQ